MIPNSDYISDGTESTMEVALWNGWDTLNEYLNSMEGYLQKATKQFEARVNKQKRTLTPEQFNEFTIDYVEESIFYCDEFPKIVRNSFFVSAYSLLEFDKGRIRRMLRKAKQKPTNLSGLIDSEICQEINNYSKVRNCVVHNNGLVKESDRDYKALIEYISKKGLIMERSIIVDETAEPEIGLTKEFCKEAVDTMQKFVDAVYKTSMTEGKQS